MIKPAIVAVGYNRPLLMKRLLESVGRASFHDTDITLIVSIDESNKSDEVEAVARAFEWKHGNKIIRRFPERQGLRRHIVACGDYSEEYGAVIILEDDLVVAEDFYSYVCAAHEKYGADARVCGVSLYSFAWNQFKWTPFTPMQKNGFDVYLGGMVVTWGQSWTASQWSRFKAWYLAHEDKLPTVNHAIPDEISSWTRSWGRYFVSYMADEHLYYIYPYVARSTCFADFGEHSSTTVPLTAAQVALMQGECEYRFGDYEDLVCYDSFYERVLPSTVEICGIPADEICMDLTGMKKSAAGCRYLLTCEELSYREIASFGLSMKPIEMNILCAVPGNVFYLYELPDEIDAFRPEKKSGYKYPLQHARLRYDSLDLPIRAAFYYAWHEFWIQLKAKFKRKR